MPILNVLCSSMYIYPQFYSSGLYNADDRAGVVVKLKVGTKIDTDADTSAETSTNTEPTDSDGKDDENKDGDACSTIDAVEMRVCITCLFTLLSLLFKASSFRVPQTCRYSLRISHTFL